jgi:hypothetical protein
MKALLVFLLLLLAPAASATVAEPADEPSTTAEGIAIATSTMFALGNIMTAASDAPYYWMGGIGLGAGVTALVLAGQDDARYRSALLATGLSAVATGIYALRYRYVLNHRAAEARIEPTWHDGSPGIALVVDFR